MAADTPAEVLAGELRSLGRSVPPTRSPELAPAVMARIASLPAPSKPRLPDRIVDALSRHRRRVVAVVLVLLLSPLAASPVRAAVADWFGFAGVVVRESPGPAPSSAPPAPPVPAALSLNEAARLVDFALVVPEALGSPDGVDVSQDRRVVSMSWSAGADGAIRLDQFGLRLDYSFAKSAEGVVATEVGGDFALWFEEPHEVVVLNQDGTSRTETARLAGNTLIWEEADTALRLEGDIPLQRAVAIAESVRPVNR